MHILVDLAENLLSVGHFRTLLKLQENSLCAVWAMNLEIACGVL